MQKRAFKEEQKLVVEAIDKRVSSINLYILNYKNDDLKINAYIQMVFEDKYTLTVGTGKLADDLVILSEVNFFEQKENYASQGDVEINKVLLFQEQLTGKKLVHVECIEKDGEDYCTRLNFSFEEKVLFIYGLIDEVGFSVS